MNKNVRNALITMLGTVMGMYIMAAPFTATVYAAAKPIADAKFFNRDYHDMPYFHQMGAQAPWEWQRYQHMMHRKAEWFRRMAMFREWQMRHYWDNYENPMAAAQAAANPLGIDVNNSNTNIIKQTPSQALIQITQSGSNDNLNITVQANPDGSWKVASVSQ